MVDSLQGWIRKSSYDGNHFSDRARYDEPRGYSNGEEVPTGGVQPKAIACPHAL